MVTLKKFRAIAHALPHTTEVAHFEKISFRAGKKIFATFDTKANRACVKLSLADQSVFCLFDKSAIYPVPNKWGLQGWTYIEMQAVRADLFKDAVVSAYQEVASKKP